MEIPVDPTNVPYIAFIHDNKLYIKEAYLSNSVALDANTIGVCGENLHSTWGFGDDEQFLGYRFRSIPDYSEAAVLWFVNLLNQGQHVSEQVTVTI